MSKAFTREDDERDGEEVIVRSALPAGARNYMTPEGAAALRDELAVLETKRRELLLVEDDEPLESRRRRLEARAREITESLSTAEVINPPDAPEGDVCFGAFVMVRDQAGVKSEYRIVGVDEVDYEKGWISWLSPLARQLIGKRAGQRFTLQTPEGANELEVTAVRYR